MAMRKFMVYLDDGSNVYKVAVPARTEQDARDYVSGNGEVIAVKDITEVTPISVTKVRYALAEYGFGMNEMDLIIRCLEQCSIAE